MSKNFVFKFFIGLLFIGASVVWLLSAMEIIDINLSWVIAAFCGGLGVAFILKGLFEKNNGTVKKLNVFFGAVLIIAGMLALVGTIIDENLVLPIIAIIVTSAVLLSVIAVGGKRWDQGDNENMGYKNYYQRKKEEEERKNRGE